jgi:Mn2+/Fe2+ NRAMP family transporter
MALTISLASSQAVMGELQISRGLKVVGWTATAVMSLAAVGMLASSIATL